MSVSLLKLDDAPRALGTTEICLECFRNVQNRNLITASALIQRVGDPRRTHQSFAGL